MHSPIVLTDAMHVKARKNFVIKILQPTSADTELQTGIVYEKQVRIFVQFMLWSYPGANVVFIFSEIPETSTTYFKMQPWPLHIKYKVRICVLQVNKFSVSFGFQIFSHPPISISLYLLSRK